MLRTTLTRSAKAAFSHLTRVGKFSTFNYSFDFLNQSHLQGVLSDYFGEKSAAVTQVLSLYRIVPIIHFRNPAEANRWLLKTIGSFADPIGKNPVNFSFLSQDQNFLKRIQQLCGGEIFVSVPFGARNFDLIIPDQFQIAHPNFFSGVMSIPPPRKIFFGSTPARSNTMSIFYSHLKRFAAQKEVDPSNIIRRNFKLRTRHELTQQVEIARRFVADEELFSNSAVLIHQPHSLCLGSIYKSLVEQNHLKPQHLCVVGEGMNLDRASQVLSVLGCAIKLNFGNLQRNYEKRSDNLKVSC